MTRFRAVVPVIARVAVVAVVLLGCSSSNRADARSAASSAVSTASSNAAQAADQAKGALGDASQSIRETALRNAVAVAGARAFGDAGHPVKGPLDCKASSPERNVFTVTCTGTTEDGKPVSVSGQQQAGAKSNFVGTLAGQQIFSKECLGNC